MPRLRSHPGRVLKAELEARGVSANQLALKIRVPANRITSILRGERAVTAETGLRLGRFLGTGAAFWMNLQTAYDISVIEEKKGRAIEKEVPAARDQAPAARGQPESSGANSMPDSFPGAASPRVIRSRA